MIAKQISSGYQISWGSPGPDVRQIKLYEVRENENPVLLKSLDGKLTNYVVPALKTNEVKSFYITYVSQEGVESAPSEVVVLSR